MGEGGEIKGALLGSLSIHQHPSRHPSRRVSFLGRGKHTLYSTHTAVEMGMGMSDASVPGISRSASIRLPQTLPPIPSVPHDMNPLTHIHLPPYPARPPQTASAQPPHTAHRPDSCCTTTTPRIPHHPSIPNLPSYTCTTHNLPFAPSQPPDPLRCCAVCYGGVEDMRAVHGAASGGPPRLGPPGRCLCGLVSCASTTSAYRSRVNISERRVDSLLGQNYSLVSEYPSPSYRVPQPPQAPIWPAQAIPHLTSPRVE